MLEYDIVFWPNKNYITDTLSLKFIEESLLVVKDCQISMFGFVVLVWDSPNLLK